MSDPFMTPMVKGSQVAMPEVREQSASVIQIESSRLLPAILFVGLLAAAALAISITGWVSANDKAALMERETRIMADDLKYIRSYLSARGIHIPANHEEAEEGAEK